MNIAIRENFGLAIYGFSGTAANNNWGQTGMGLMNRMWQEVNSHGLKHKGINIWVYEAGRQMFAGVELEATPPFGAALEFKRITLSRYACFKHTGPYDKISDSGADVLRELERQGIKTRLPYLEIYGHWTNDPSKLETELLWCIQ